MINILKHFDQYIIYDIYMKINKYLLLIIIILLFYYRSINNCIDTFEPLIEENIVSKIFNNNYFKDYFPSVFFPDIDYNNPFHMEKLDSTKLNMWKNEPYPTQTDNLWSYTDEVGELKMSTNLVNDIKSSLHKDYYGTGTKEVYKKPKQTVVTSDRPKVKHMRYVDKQLNEINTSKKGKLTKSTIDNCVNHRNKVLNIPVKKVKKNIIVPNIIPSDRTITINLENGDTINVIIPEGKKTGDTLSVDIDSDYKVDDKIDREIDNYIPVCNTIFDNNKQTSTYKSMQCSDNYCWCVNPNGEEIPFTNKIKLSNPTNSSNLNKLKTDYQMELEDLTYKDIRKLAITEGIHEKEILELEKCTVYTQDSINRNHKNGDKVCPSENDLRGKLIDIILSFKITDLTEENCNYNRFYNDTCKNNSCGYNTICTPCSNTITCNDSEIDNKYKCV